MNLFFILTAPGYRNAFSEPDFIETKEDLICDVNDCIWRLKVKEDLKEFKSCFITLQPFQISIMNFGNKENFKVPTIANLRDYWSLLDETTDCSSFYFNQIKYIRLSSGQILPRTVSEIDQSKFLCGLDIDRKSCCLIIFQPSNRIDFFIGEGTRTPRDFLLYFWKLTKTQKNRPYSYFPVSWEDNWRKALFKSQN